MGDQAKIEAVECDRGGALPRPAPRLHDAQNRGSDGDGAPHPGRHCMFTKAELDPYDVQRKQLQEQGWKHVRGDQLQLPPVLSS